MKMWTAEAKTYRFNLGRLIWENDSWTVVFKPKAKIESEEHIIALKFLQVVISDIVDQIDKMYPYSIDEKLVKKILKKLLKSYRAKFINLRQGALLDLMKDHAKIEEFNDLQNKTYKYTFHLINCKSILKNDLGHVADEISYAFRTTDKEKTYIFERYGVYYEAHGPKSIKEKEETIAIW